MSQVFIYFNFGPKKRHLRLSQTHSGVLPEFVKFKNFVIEGPRLLQLTSQ